ncbi:MAG: hypothetical protein AAFX03_02085 [Pseudomonadota bacterium]
MAINPAIHETDAKHGEKTKNMPLVFGVSLSAATLALAAMSIAFAA